jgi:hypothetical protein
MKFNFLDRFSENIQVPNFIKTWPVSADLFHGDRLTDKYEEAYSRFSQFCGRI